jgi:hypothetical protein
MTDEYNQALNISTLSSNSSIINEYETKWYVYFIIIFYINYLMFSQAAVMLPDDNEEIFWNKS